MDATRVAQVTAALAGVMLLAAAGAKLAERAPARDFVAALGLPLGAGDALLRALPVLELLAGGWLLSGLLPVAAASATAVLCGSFVAVLVLARARGVTEPCRCFGALDRSQPAEVSLARAVFLLCVAATCLAAAAAHGNPRFAAPDAASWLGALLAVCALLAFALVGQALSFHRLLRNPAGHAEGGHHGVTST